MTAPTVVTDPVENNQARVTSFGQLVVAPLSFDLIEATLVNNSVPVTNVLSPSGGQAIVITGIFAAGRKSINASTPIRLSLFGATLPDSTVSEKEFPTIQVSRSENVPILPINLFVPKGLFVNAQVDGTGDIDLTIFYYRVPAKDV